MGIPIAMLVLPEGIPNFLDIFISPCSDTSHHPDHLWKAMVGDALRVEMPRRFDVCVFDPQDLPSIFIDSSSSLFLLEFV